MEIEILEMEYRYDKTFTHVSMAGQLFAKSFAYCNDPLSKCTNIITVKRAWQCLLEI
jgi:hypothetical protein